MVGGYKRPSVEKSATPSKRAKTSMRGITPVKDHGVGFGCVPADPEFIDTRDNDLPDGLSLLNFVNVKAAKLYESVANFADFQIANEVFWSTFFINQRGCPENSLVPLFKQLFSSNVIYQNADTIAREAYKSEFLSSHEAFVKWFVNETDGFVREWMDSPAGEAWVKELEKCRQKKKSISTLVLDNSKLESVTFENEVYIGVKLDGPRMWKYWKRVLCVYDVELVDEANFYWPVLDLQDGIDKEDSLYQRVARAFIEVLLPVLDIRCQDIGKVRHTLFNSNTTSSLLAGAYTQGGLDAAKTAGNALAPQPVPIADRSLSEWGDYLFNFKQQHLVAPQSPDVSEFRSFREIDCMDEGNAHSDVMEEHWSKGIPAKDKEYVQQEEIKVHNKIQEEITKNMPPFIAEHLPPERLFSAAAYPARAIAPVANALASDITMYNFWGRTALHIREGKERMQQLHALMVGIKLELQLISERSKELLKEKHDLERTTKFYLELQKELEVKKAEEKELIKMNNEMRDSSVVNQAMSMMKRKDSVGIRRSLTPVASTSSAHLTNPPLPPVPSIKAARALVREDESDDDLDNYVSIMTGSEQVSEQKMQDEN